MFCFKCGRQIPEHARFCPWCAAFLPQPNIPPAPAPAPVPVAPVVEPADREPIPDFEITIEDPESPLQEQTPATESAASAPEESAVPIAEEAEGVDEQTPDFEITVEEVVSIPEETYGDDHIPDFEITVEDVPVKKKGRIWPPLVAMAILVVIGFGIFFATKTDSVVYIDPMRPWFQLQDGVLYFDRTRYTGGSELTVPATINGQKVLHISDQCFANCDGLVTVYLPEGIESIGDQAFADCNDLRGIKLPETAKSAGYAAFAGCTDLEAICIPYGLTDIDRSIFLGCDELVHVFYPGPMADFKKLPLENLPEGANIYCADGTITID